MSAFKTVRGMRDFLPKDTEKIRRIEQIARELAGLYGYEEVITPVLESYDLLAAKAGEEIRLRMYAFKDLSGRKVALRPEFTPSIARLVATRLRTAPKPLKLFCMGSLYRYDEPQYGRFREFWQVNYELMGSSRAEADAEILAITNDLLQKLGFKSYCLKIGHMGIIRGILSQEDIPEKQQNRVMQLLDHKQWEEALALTQKLGVSQKCLTTLKDVFEIKGKDAAKILQKVKATVKDCEEAVAAVENLQEILDLTLKSGFKFEALLEAGFARGLEYYTGMIVEAYVSELEGLALGGGGRYDRLIELFGGEPTPAVGIALGPDRFVLAMEKQNIQSTALKRESVLVTALKQEMRVKALELSSVLRKNGISAETEVMGRELSKALGDADRRGFTHAVIVAPKEAREGKVILRDMKRREQKTVKVKGIIKEIQEAREQKQ
jgi:histidyl-tRNA synthetase